MGFDFDQFLFLFLFFYSMVRLCSFNVSENY